MTRLAVFDIDGTLTDTMGVDNECYRAAVADALGLDVEDVDWRGAAHVTDAGIFQWLCEQHGLNHLAADAQPRARARFFRDLELAIQATPERFAEIPGAAAALRAMTGQGWHYAFATGGWGPSAMMKLRTAGIEVNEAVFACADDAVTRPEIVELAIERAERHYERSFDRIVVLGDAPWDVRAAIELDLPFIGIGRGERAERLRRHGAWTVIPDYADFAAFRQALNLATVPRPVRTP